MLDEGKSLEDIQPDLWEVTVKLTIAARTGEDAEEIVSTMIEENAAIEEYEFIPSEEAEEQDE